MIAIAFLLGVGGAAAALRRESAAPYGALAERHIVADVIFLERPRAAGDGQSVRTRIVRVDQPSGAAAAALSGEDAVMTMHGSQRSDDFPGRMARVRGRLSLPAGPRNDGEPAERDVLAEQGISVLLSVPPGGVTFIGPATGWEAWWARLRLRFAVALESRLPALDAIVLEGILWGDRGNLPAALRQEFSDTGTVHVLTTAGLHLGIFAALVSGLLLRLALPRPLRAALVVMAAWSYAMLAGLHLPTLRAATMLTSGTIAQELGRGRSPSAVLATAALAVIVPHPLVLLSPSFSMSFACVCGIALLGPALERAGFEDERGLPAKVMELMRTSVAVQAALWPLQALYFNAFTPYAMLANVVVVPLVGIAMALGASLVCALLWLPMVAAPLANLTWWCTALLTAAVEKFASLPYAHVDVPPPTHAFLVLYWIALAGFAWAVQNADRARTYAKFFAPACAILAIAYCLPGIATGLDPRLRLDVIDVGQADCILIRSRGWHALLVDGGGKLERTALRGMVVAQPIGDVIATKTVMPFLMRHWVLGLDAVVLTHPHGDHAGGLPVVLSQERVRAVYDSAQLYGGPAYQRALQVVHRRRIAYRVARRGLAFDVGAARVTVLAPELPLITGTSSDINNNSVVLRVAFGKVALLLTGDAQSEAEQRLLSHGGADLAADVLKVGHHGSAYSSTPQFLAAVHPRLAVISCGLHNMFGHPSPLTLAALRAAGARVYRTDIEGGVTVWSDGKSITAAAQRL